MRNNRRAEIIEKIRHFNEKQDFHVTEKIKEREEIQRLTDEFLKKGGEITEIEYGIHKDTGMKYKNGKRIDKDNTPDNT